MPSEPRPTGFEPQNELERSLVKAATDPAHRPQFYRDLARSDVFVIRHGAAPPRQAGRRTLQQGMTLEIQNIQHAGKMYVPIFSSVLRIRAVIEEDVAYLGLNAIALFKITRGSALMLNPGSAYDKEIAADEAARIADGTIGEPTERYVVEKDTQVMIGVPANVPTELIGALSRFFETRKGVQRAWLAHFFNPAQDKAPHTLIALEVTSDYDTILAEAGAVIESIDVPDPPVDVLRVTGREGIDQYFLKEAKPFYQRRFLGLF
jgi:hypothetical protein